MTLLEVIRRNRMNRAGYCPAYKGPCSTDCFMQNACRTRPAAVMNLISRLDEQTIEAMHTLGKKLL